MKRSLKTEIRPNRQQIAFFNLCCLANKMVYNWAVETYTNLDTAASDLVEKAARENGFTGDWTWAERKLWTEKFTKQIAADNNILAKDKEYSLIPYKQGWKISPSAYSLGPSLTKAKKDNHPRFARDWCPNVLKITPQTVHEFALAGWEQGWKMFFEKTNSRPPTFKKSVDSFTSRRILELEDEEIELLGQDGMLRKRTRTKVQPQSKKFLKTSVAIKEHDYPASKISRITISTRAGRWFIAPLFEVPDPVISAASEPPIGIDLNTREFVARDHDGFEIRFQCPRPLEAFERQLKMLDRRIARCKKGSRKRKMYLRRRASRFMRIANIRDAFIQEICAILVQHKQIVIEDLDVAKMVKGGRYSKGLLDACFGKFVQVLTAKSKAAGCEVLSAKILSGDDYFPSSQICPACPAKNKFSTEEREYSCECGFVGDRDSVAASNLVSLVPRCVGEFTLCQDKSTGIYAVSQKHPSFFNSDFSYKQGEANDLHLDRCLC